MIHRDLSDEALEAVTCVDLAHVTEEPASIIEPFDLYGCTCGGASFVGRPPWERHTAGDELLLVLDGETELTIYEPAGATERVLQTGSMAVVPQGCWHSNNAPTGVTLFYMTPSEGNEHSWEDPLQDASG